MYATPDQKEALVFSYLKRKEIYGNEQVLMLRGLDPKKSYIFKEINKDTKKYSWLTPFEGQRLTGEFLMTYGVRFTMYQEYESAVFQLIAE
jgi:alpha-galactosidase